MEVEKSTRHADYEHWVFVDRRTVSLPQRGHFGRAEAVADGDG